MNLAPLTSPQRIWLLVLLALWALFLFGGFLLGPTRGNRRISRRARIASSATLVAAGWSWQFFALGSGAWRYAFLLAVGITFGLIGDLFLANLLSRSRSRSVMGGIGAFAIGHLFYISGILLLVNRFHLNRPQPLWGALIAFWLAALAGWYIVVLRGQENPSTLHWAALPYALLLATTAGLAAGAALQNAAFFPLALGAFLFLFSDLVLAGALFSDLNFPLVHDVVWLSYGPGQMLIVFSVGAAMMLG
jgi:hypothetical protein